MLGNCNENNERIEQASYYKPKQFSHINNNNNI